MENKIVVSKRFRKNTLKVYEYLIKEYSAKTAFSFLDKLQQRVELITQYPEIGKPSQKKENIRSVTLHPHNRIYYRLNKNKIELLCLFDMRKKKHRIRSSHRLSKVFVLSQGRCGSICCSNNL